MARSTAPIFRATATAARLKPSRSVRPNTKPSGRGPGGRLPPRTGRRAPACHRALRPQCSYQFCRIGDAWASGRGRRRPSLTEGSASAPPRPLRSSRPRQHRPPGRSSAVGRSRPLWRS
jgi:hypothetical protein